MNTLESHFIVENGCNPEEIRHWHWFKCVRLLAFKRSIVKSAPLINVLNGLIVQHYFEECISCFCPCMESQWVQKHH